MRQSSLYTLIVLALAVGPGRSAPDDREPPPPASPHVLDVPAPLIADDKGPADRPAVAPARPEPPAPEPARSLVAEPRADGPAAAAPDRPPALTPVARENPPSPPHPPAFRLVAGPEPPCPVTVVQKPVVADEPVLPAAPPERPAPAATGTEQPRAPAAPDYPVASSSPPGAAAVSVEKVGPPAIRARQPFFYEIRVRNTGTGAAHQVYIQDVLPPEVHYLGAEPTPERQGERLLWNLGPVPGGGERCVRVQGQAARDLDGLPPASVSFAGQAGHPVPPGTNAPGAPPSVPDPPAHGVASLERAGAHDLPAGPCRLAVKMTGPELAPVGGPAAFQIEVSNPGDRPAAGLVLRVHLSSGLQHPQGSDIEADLGTLAPRQSRQIPLTITAARAGHQTAEATVLAGDGARASARAGAEVVEGGLLVRLVGPQRGMPERELEFHVQLDNATGQATGSLRITNRLAPGLEFVSAGDDGTYDKVTRTVTWQIDGVAARQSRALVVKLLPKASGDLAQQVNVQAGPGEEVKCEGLVHVEALPALTLDVSNKESQVEVGVETTYEVRVVNRGSGAGTGVQVVALVPEGLQIQDARGPSAYQVRGQEVVFTPLARLDAGAEVGYTLRVRCRTAGDWRVRALLTSDQLRQPLVREESTHVYNDRN